MGHLHLLGAGTDTLDLYSDASYFNEVELGSWTYLVPAFPMLRSGVESAPSVNQVEFAAVVHGLIATVSMDRSMRPMRVHTDSEFVLQVMKHVSNRSSGSAVPKRLTSVSDLYALACDVTAGRSVTAGQRRKGDPHHATCDRTAREQLRRHCTDPKLAWTLLMKRAQARRADLIAERNKVEQLLRRLENKLVQCDMEIAALRFSPAEALSNHHGETDNA